MTQEEDRSEVIPLVEETVRIDKKEVVTGRVTVRTLTEGADHFIGQDLDKETVEITRVSVDREVAEAPAIRQEGNVTIISLVEEVVVVIKRLVVREEVHITRIRSTERVETTMGLRKQTAIVERVAADQQTSKATRENMP